MNDHSTVRLREASRACLGAHFLALGPEDRRLRFGSTLGDEALAGYVARIDFNADGVFAVHDDALSVVAAVHVAMAGSTAELGLSVLPGWRGRGIGDRLLQRAVTWLRNRSVFSVYVHCIAENAAMVHLARKNGMRIVWSGAESDGRLELEPPTPATFAQEWLDDQHGHAMQALRHNARWMHALFTAH